MLNIAVLAPMPRASVSNRGERESRCTPEVSERVCDILKQCVDVDTHLHVPHLFLERLHAAHFDRGGAPRLPRLHAARDPFFDQQVEHRPQLIVQIALHAIAAP